MIAPRARNFETAAQSKSINLTSCFTLSSLIQYSLYTLRVWTVFELRVVIGHNTISPESTIGSSVRMTSFVTIVAGLS
ncbi:hypothetical protein Pelo_6337 [Pelomyxa schiedti]|nr:hypothetical protein Pelo_6337 [Pelomyxa schiedti]